MSYIKESEIPIYCGLVRGVTMEHVEAATTLIDAYKGTSFLPTQHVERVELKQRRGEYRGKLNHFPRICIDKITAKVRSIFGDQKLELPVDCIDFDDDLSLYFTFTMPRELMFRSVPQNINIVYHSGYNVIPEQLKRACGILACNIKQMGGVMRWKQRDDYDIKVTLSDEGVFTEEIKVMLRGVEIR